jgi:hypothetical protein
MPAFRHTLLVLLFVAMRGSTARAEPQGLCGGAPMEFEQSVEVIQGDFKIVLSTDRARYVLGDPVWMRLEITNLGVDSVAIQSTGDPMERFELYPDSCVSGNCVETWTYPPMVNYSGDLIGLAPGKPQTRCAVWNGVATQGDSTVAPGIYQIVAGFTTATPSHPIPQFVYPEGGLTIAIDYSLTVSNSPSTWGELKKRWIERRPRLGPRTISRR